MTKADLIAYTAKATEQPKALCEKVLTAALREIHDALGRGEKVQWLEFGTWSIKERAARPGRNPQTKELIEIPAKQVVKFSPSKSLAEKVAATG
jgi:DNA-binding protein HU-beta